MSRPQVRLRRPPQPDHHATITRKTLIYARYEVTSYSPETGNYRYDQQKLKLPRCRKCGKKWGAPGNVNDHPFVKEELASGWKIGTEPDQSDVTDFMIRQISRYR